MSLPHHDEMQSNQALGRTGETLAAEYLENHGYAVIDRNWHCRTGEFDIVATDQNYLVFVEVKTRSNTSFGHPFESVTTSKVARMRRLANEWCLAKASPGFRIRLDAISVLFCSGQVKIEHLKAIS